jgi:hypothetical protein
MSTKITLNDLKMGKYLSEENCVNCDILFRLNNMNGKSFSQIEVYRLK